jgi:protein phosphatase PTC1
MHYSVIIWQVWDILSDQEAVDIVSPIADAQEAASFLVQYALQNGSTDNLSVMLIRFPQQ